MQTEIRRTDLERIARIEEHMNDQDKRLVDIALDIKEVKTILQSLSNFEERLKRLETASNLWKWLSPSLAAVLGAVLSLLVESYLHNLP